MNNKKGFTLIELLVVIAIIGLLSTLAVVALGNARSKSRDARRLSDIKQIQTALELYMNDIGKYPTPPAATICRPTSILGDIGGCCISSGSTQIIKTCSGTTYMGTAPDDPQPQTSTPSYNISQVDTSTYAIVYYLENLTNGMAPGKHTATPAGIANP